MPEYSEAEKKILVIGHKNPDTDSICSAIAYAGLKNKTEENVYIPARAGDITGETKFVLDYFNVSPPMLCPDVSIQLKDIELRKMQGVSCHISLKEAWNLMRDTKIDTLPIVDEDKKLLGLITVKVIATSYMDIYDNNILALSKTPYSNILKTLDGEMVVGEGDDFVANGNIIIATANPDVLENVINKGDIVILGNRYEAQLCSIEMEAGAIIVCMDAPVSKTIKALAKARGCRIIRTPYDTYMAARLINQSAPICYFMKKDGLITFNLNTSVDAASAVMATERHRYFPVMDKDGNYFAMLSRRNLLNKKRKQLILVDHNEKTQAAEGIEEAEILEIVDHHRIGNLETASPVFFRNYPLGSTCTIIAELYKEKGISLDKETAGLLTAAIISDTLMFRSPTCTKTDIDTAKYLSAIAEIDINKFADAMFYAGSDIKNKTPKEIFYSDFKIFTYENLRFGVGQSSFINESALKAAKKHLEDYLPLALKGENVDMVFYMLTNIAEERTGLMYCGKKAKQLIEHAFGAEESPGYVILNGVVSRKKQVVPALMNDIAQLKEDLK